MECLFRSLALLLPLLAIAHAKTYQTSYRFDNSTVIHHRLLRTSSKGQSSPADWKAVGRYVLINNPKLGRSSTGQVAIHAMLVPSSYKIVIAGRNLPKKGPKSVPEPGVGGNVSTIWDAKTGTYTIAPNVDTLFCTAHTMMSDGNIVAAGGDMGFDYPWMKEGRDKVRIFDIKSMKWITLPGVKLSEFRWYPTQVNLPDDRVLIISGFLDDPARPFTAKPAPSIDIFDYKTRRLVVSKSKYDLGKKFFTNITPGYQLYPHVYLMPWTDPNKPGDYFLYMYTCRTGQIVRLTTNNDFIPLWTFPGLPMDNMCSAFSAMGSSAILPLRPEKGYAFEVAMIGGGTQGKGMDCKGICNAPASPYIFRMALPTVQEALAGKWKTWRWSSNKPYETMPIPRVFADAILLPNGKIVVANGAKKGVPGGNIDGGASAKDAAYTALLYDAEAPLGKRMTTLASSTIHRYYHANALLLPSGDIWIAGSEQADCVDDCRTGGKSPADQEYRAELLQLPYAFQPRPVITSISGKAVKYGGKLTISYTTSSPITAASIIPPGANTHGLNMMQRVIFLSIASNKDGKVVLVFPKASDRVANPGWYMLWILAGDVPCKEAAWVQLTY